VAGSYGTVQVNSGKIVAGDGLIPLDSKASDPRTQLSREEILAKIKRGEAVSREDLLRAMGEQGK